MKNPPRFFTHFGYTLSFPFAIYSISLSAFPGRQKGHHRFKVLKYVLKKLYAN